MNALPPAARIFFTQSEPSPSTRHERALAVVRGGQRAPSSRGDRCACSLPAKLTWISGRQDRARDTRAKGPDSRNSPQAGRAPVSGRKSASSRRVRAGSSRGIHTISALWIALWRRLAGKLAFSRGLREKVAQTRRWTGPTALPVCHEKPRIAAPHISPRVLHRSGTEWSGPRSGVGNVLPGFAFVEQLAGVVDLLWRQLHLRRTSQRRCAAFTPARTRSEIRIRSNAATTSIICHMVQAPAGRCLCIGQLIEFHATGAEIIDIVIGVAYSSAHSTPQYKTRSPGRFRFPATQDLPIVRLSPRKLWARRSAAFLGREKLNQHLEHPDQE